MLVRNLFCPIGELEPIGPIGPKGADRAKACHRAKLLSKRPITPPIALALA